MKNVSTIRKHLNLLMICLILFINMLPLQAAEGPDESETLRAENDPGIEDSPMEDVPLSTQSSKLPYLPGDGLWISTFPDTTSFLNQTFPIDDRGYVDFPLVGRINVVQMTEQQLVGFIRNNYKLYTRSPNVAIKPMLRISMIGGFIRPGLYYVDYGASFWNTVRLAGGPILEDGIAEMQWERNGESVVDDLSPFIQRGVSLKNMGFKSGDIVWTPSPATETTGDQILKYGLPIITITTSLVMMWLYYQQTFLIYSTR